MAGIFDRESRFKVKDKEGIEEPVLLHPREKTILTAEARRTQSLIFDLFSFDPAKKSGTCRTKENK